MINLEHLELLRPWDLRASSLEAPGLHDTNLNTRSTQSPRGQELLGHIKNWPYSCLKKSVFKFPNIL